MTGARSSFAPELWGGHECTVNRVGDSFMDQTVVSGHQDRLSDLDLFAGLGLKALRYPVLWERVSPQSPDRADWAWSDERLGRLRELNIRPIVGLTHHGSGPIYTDLLDEGFAPGLARHAAAVAERYPWVEDWTPVNEPLTTARFSALYGHWYPHRRSEKAFWTCLLNQIDAVRLSMKAIRAVNPAARLVQTEDLGRVYSTAPCAEQALFENHRRWMTWDLLFGRVGPEHALWRRLAAYGLEARLAAIAEDPCPPDVIGINHYVTSDRFLDHRLDRYPAGTHGGNERLRYADVEAVRVLEHAPPGLARAIDETWERYGSTLAVTECHLGCTREEQVRWLREGWDTVQAAHARGVDIRALTAWSLLGAYDWDSLLTRPRGRYEAGVFDLRGGVPRPTRAAALLKAITARPEACPVEAIDGWWRRETRLLFPPSRSACRSLKGDALARRDLAPPPPLLILGATGTLGQALARECELRALPYVLTGRERVRLDDPASIRSALEDIGPWAVVNAAGWVRVDDAEADPDGCILANARGAVALGEACRDRELPLVSFSSDLVFDGALDRAFVESDAPNPLNVYGRSKAEMEQGLAALGGRNLIVRTAAFFSPHDPYNFARFVADRLTRGETMTAAADLTVSPTYVPDLTRAVIDLLIDGETGVWHLANKGALTWHGFAQAVAGALRLDATLLSGVPVSELDFAAPRPPRVELASERGLLLPSFEDALERFARAMADRGVPSRIRVAA